MRPRLVVLAFLLAVPHLPSTLAGTDAAVAFHLTPTIAPADGSPFAVVLNVTGAPGETVEVKAWVGSYTTTLSRSWDGLTWIYGARYAIRAEFDAEGRFQAVVPMSVEHDPGDVLLLARARIAGRTLTPVVAQSLTLVAADELVPRWSFDEVAVASGNGTAMGVAVPDREGAVTPHARVFAPAAWSVTNETRPPAARFTHVTRDEARVEVAEAAVVCLVTRETACTPLERGNTTLPLPGRGGVALAVWGRVVDEVEPPSEGALNLEDGRWVARPLGFTPTRADVVEAERATVFAYPDGGLPAFLHVARAAEARLDAAVYKLEGEAAAHALAAAAARGVTVRLLVEGHPVGGMSTQATRLLGALAAEGVEVRLLERNGTHPARYLNLHAKMLVADERIALVGSENWHARSMPEAGAGGNRGWGVILEGDAIGGVLADVFDHDWAGVDAVPLVAAGASPLLPPVEPPPFRGLASATRVPVRPVLAPDDAVAPVEALIEGAAATVDAQLLFVHPRWGDEPNPWLAALLDAASRGVAVRVHLDGNVRDNGEAAEVIAARARSLPFEVMVDASGRTIHNKGVVVDGERVLIGSLNWGHASATKNREVAVILEDAHLAAALLAVFDGDWAGPGLVGHEKKVAWPSVAAAVVVAAVAAVARRRT